jgi:hypothetical protein
MELVEIPKLTDSRADFETLFGIARRIHALRNEKIVLDFSGCADLMQNAVSVLGGLTKLAGHHGCQVEFAWHTLSTPVQRNLARNGLMQFIGRPALRTSSTAVPFRHDERLVEDDLVHYLYDSWIGKGRVHLSEGLKAAILPESSSRSSTTPKRRFFQRYRQMM